MSLSPDQTFLIILEGDWNLSELEIVRINFYSKLEIVRIGNCQNWKLSELEIVRIGNCQNWKLSELEIVRITNCQNRKLSESEFVRIGNYPIWGPKCYAKLT